MSQIVYLVKRQYCNGVDSWETTKSIHLTKDSAENAIVLLMCFEGDAMVDFSVEEWPLLEIDTEGKPNGNK